MAQKKKKSVAEVVDNVKDAVADGAEAVVDAVADTAETGKDILEDGYEELHKEHTFSLADSWYELLAVIFAIVYMVFKTCRFIFDGGYEQGFVEIISFVFSLIMSIFVICCFCAVIEVQEKLDIMNHNMDLMAHINHMHFVETVDRLDDIGEMLAGEHAEATPDTKE